MQTIVIKSVVVAIDEYCLSSSESFSFISAQLLQPVGNCWNGLSEYCSDFGSFVWTKTSANFLIVHPFHPKDVSRILKMWTSCAALWTTRAIFCHK